MMAARRLKPTHPGKILWKEFMEPTGITAYALAKVLHVSLSRLNYTIREERAISPDLAVLLSVYFGTSDWYWIKLQAHYDLEMAKRRLAKQVCSHTTSPS